MKRRTADGNVSEWSEHGLTCPVAKDLTGDVMLLHERGDATAAIRERVEREISFRDPLPA